MSCLAFATKACSSSAVHAQETTEHWAWQNWCGRLNKPARSDMAEGFITREVTKASLDEAMAQSVIVLSQAEQTPRRPFGSTRSQVRILSPRLINSTSGDVKLDSIKTQPQGFSVGCDQRCSQLAICRHESPYARLLNSKGIAKTGPSTTECRKVRLQRRGGLSMESATYSASWLGNGR